MMWFGLVAGWIEVAGLALRHSSGSPMMALSRDFIWMTPLATSLTMLLAGVALVVPAMIWPRFPAAALALFGGLAFAASELLLYIPGLYDWAILVLAVGLAARLTMAFRPRLEAVYGVARRTTPWLAALIPLVGGGLHAWRAFSERRALANLPPAAAGAQNVIVITLDAVRAANLSTYGYSRRTTPELDSFAQRGAVFERAMAAAPWTLPSHASMFTGRWHHELSADYTTPLDPTFPTLAGFLTSKGYATGGFVANLRYCGYETGLNRGFIRYRDYPVSLGQLLSSSKILRTGLDNFRLRRWIRNDQHLVRKSAETVNQEVLAWVARAGSRPFFIFANYFDAHEPYLPPPPWDRSFGPGRSLGRYSPLHRWLWEPSLGHANMGPAEQQEELDAYDGALAHLDHQLGQLFRELERRGVLERTLVVITSDHGEEFGEHGVYEHGYSLFRPVVQVPLVVSLPGVVPHGMRVSQPVTLRDLAVTIAELLGVGAVAPFPGSSLAAYWREGAPARDDEFIVSEVHRVTGQPDWFPVSQGDLRSVTYRGWRYIRRSDGAEQLFDFDHDPWERNDLAGAAAYGPMRAQYRALIDSATSVSRPQSR
jgi:arylsulfatase A-like enzyme